MDRLRAIQGFTAAADGASLSAAARQHGVSVAAVAKLIAALEAELSRLGVPLEGLDLVWTASVREETEAVIADLRKDPRFARALPATALWPELQWRGKNT